jgi:hypothetical protein
MGWDGMGAARRASVAAQRDVVGRVVELDGTAEATLDEC